MNKSSAKRIIAIDLMRAFAVVMMIQGHTVQSLLDVSYKTSDSFVYHTWLFLRSFTAPLFIFVSGMIFTYLLFQNKNIVKSADSKNTESNSKNQFSFRSNPRILKGIKRGISLILIGYLLRYPTIKIFGLEGVSYSQWITFFAVDALHLIGVGLVLIVLFATFSFKLKANPIITFSILAMAVFIASPFVNLIEWNSSANIFLTSYITFQFGSILPLFPYLQFVFIGAVLGIMLSEKPKLLCEKRNLLVILLFGSVVVFISYITNTEYSYAFLRIGVIIFLLSLFGFLGNTEKLLPKFIKSLARNSIWLYIIHLVILYGSPISIGLFQIVGKTLSAEISIFIALIMLILMTIISLGIDKLRVNSFEKMQSKIG